MIQLTIPYPPSVNSYKHVGKLTTTTRGKLYQPRVNTEATKRFYYEVWHKVMGLRIPSLGAALISLEFDVYPPDKRRRDLDNIIKPGIDSLMRSGLFDDDSQISRLHVERKAIIDSGQIIVRISVYVP